MRFRKTFSIFSLIGSCSAFSITVLSHTSQRDPDAQVYMCTRFHILVKDIKDMFNDHQTVSKIQSKLPTLFKLAELESTRGGKIGMEVGTIRERILISLLRYYFGKNDVNINIPITDKETDVIVLGTPISIKTKTKSLSGVKIVWTVDWEMSEKFIKAYKPSTAILFALIDWNKEIDGLLFIPLDVQQQMFDEMKLDYFKGIKHGTNPRGVEFSQDAMQRMICHSNTPSIKIKWEYNEIEFDIYEKWDQYWNED